MNITRLVDLLFYPVFSCTQQGGLRVSISLSKSCLLVSFFFFFFLWQASHSVFYLTFDSKSETYRGMSL